MLEYNGFGKDEPDFESSKRTPRFPMRIPNADFMPDQMLGLSILLRLPVCRLMWAVLEDAITRLLRNCNRDGRRAKRLFEEAEEWFLSSDLQWPYSFENICSAFNIDSDYIRMGLWRKVHFLQQEKESWHKSLRNPVTRKTIS